MELAPVDIKLEGIGHILRDRRLRVPQYQRRYSWDTEQVSDFWWDLRAAFAATNPQYFLGTIVLTREGSPVTGSIVDGQQRLTTTSLLFIALRNEFLRRGETTRAIVIEREYGLVPDLRLGKEITRLRLNPQDQPTYEHLVSWRPASGDAVHATTIEEPLLVQALRFLETQIHNEAKQAGPNWPEILFRWVEFMEQRARVISVTVGDESDAFLIFETLNARGRALTVADLLKNYLFGLAGTDLEVLQENWMSALRTLETSADEEIFTTYVRHLWSSFRGATRERELYARLKASITSKPEALKFGRQLEQAAGHYAALLSPEQPFWTSRNAIRPYAETMLRLGLEQPRPLLLAAMRTFDDAELFALIRALISWSVRGLVVGGIGGGTAERAYGEAAVAVSEGRAKNTGSIFEELTTLVPTDELFRQSFAARTIRRTRIAKYILVALARAEDGFEDAYATPDGIESEYELRPVLPRNPKVAEWPNFAPDEVSQWAQRLGNLYVVHGGGLKEEPAADLINRARWSPQLIQKRQNRLADAAVRLWPRRP